MSNKCDLKIKIPDKDEFRLSEIGIYLIKSPSTLFPDIKDSNIVVTDFPEEDGVDVYVPQSPSQKEFDYTIQLLYFSKDLNSANAVINSLCSDIAGKKVQITNEFKNTMVVGFLKSYKEGSFLRDESDCVTFELTFLIPKPSECNFALTI